jgi:hypothetical protein
MTLVVARKTSKAIVVVCDTKLTPHDGDQWSQANDSCNKVTCLASGWCIAFAGNVTYAEIVVKAFFHRESVTFGELCDACVRLNKESIANESSTDFLLISGFPLLTIFKVASGKCGRCASGSWIGEQAAFSVFQEVMHLAPTQKYTSKTGTVLEDPLSMSISETHLRRPGDDETAENLRSRMSRSMAVAIADETIPSVGGYPINLMLDRLGINVMPILVFHRSTYFPDTPDRNSLYGAIASGDFNYSLMAGSHARSNFVAIYFRQSMSALVMRPWDGGLSYGKFVPDLTIAECREKLQTMFNVSIWQGTAELQADGAHHLSSVGYPYA